MNNLIKFKYLSFLIFFIISNIFTQDSNRYTWKYNTFAHNLLKMEEDISSLNYEEKVKTYDKMFILLDNVIENASLRIKPYLLNGIPVTPNTIIPIFGAIDSTLLENNFLVCIMTENLTSSFTKWTLIQLKKIDSIKCTLCLNSLRDEYILKHKNEYFYIIDCDIGALIYLAIGEVNNLPLKIVEVPNHNFIRWRIDKNTHINWDNNRGQEITDNQYRKGGVLCANSIGFDIAEENKKKYLTDISNKDFLDYYYWILGGMAQRNNRFKLAEEYYIKSLNSRPYESGIMNSLAWMYITVPEFKNKENYEKAYELSLKSIKFSPDNENYIDTYSCTCAAIGDFQKAIEIELKLEKLRGESSKRIDFFKAGKTCLDMGEK